MDCNKMTILKFVQDLAILELLLNLNIPQKLFLTPGAGFSKSCFNRVIA